MLLLESIENKGIAVISKMRYNVRASFFLASPYYHDGWLKAFAVISY